MKKAIMVLTLYNFQSIGAAKVIFSESPSTRKWLNNIWYVQIMKYFAVTIKIIIKSHTCQAEHTLCGNTTICQPGELRLGPEVQFWFLEYICTV